jgi:hypothetical protein
VQIVVDFGWLVGTALSSALVLLLRDWRITVPALLAHYICVAFFLAQQQAFIPSLLIEQSISTLIAVKLVTGVSVSLILALTALTFSRDYGLEDLDEFGLSELRRAARAAQRHRASEPFRWSNYAVPLGVLLLALATSLVLPNLYPLATSRSLNFSWYWLGLTGIFTLITATDLLKIGLGLLLCTSSIDLLYTAVVSTAGASGVGFVPLALLSLVTILLALVVAYLSGLLYGRLKTLDLGELYKTIGRV